MPRRIVPALQVHQWLAEWEKVPYDPKAHRRKPDKSFYLFRLPADDLRALSGIYRRTTTGPRAEDLGIERRHDPKRSKEIRAFVQYGFPWSEMSEDKWLSGRYDDLRKPGWLPTAIVVNILREGDERAGLGVAAEDLIGVKDREDGFASVSLPESFTGSGWTPRRRLPLEVIDGQHRLWAFEDGASGGEFELPVVAFHGLDISWQAYLFYTINIKPKRINPSLAFDLYPLLRTEDWLEKFEGHSIYRETRAQELTEALWSNPRSPWYQRVNMLGEPKQKGVSQAAWVRSLMATYVKLWEGPGIRIGGLFGAPAGSQPDQQEALPWSRSQQAAFLIFAWQQLGDAVKACQEAWAKALRREALRKESGFDPAFAGESTLLNTDQGVRGFLYVTNDCSYVTSDEFGLQDWAFEQPAAAVDEEAVNDALRSLSAQRVAGFLNDIAGKLSTYDWRTAAAALQTATNPDGLTDQLRTAKLAFRGSSGYKELRRQLLTHLSQLGGPPANIAIQVAEILGYRLG